MKKLTHREAMQALFDGKTVVCALDLNVTYFYKMNAEGTAE